MWQEFRQFAMRGNVVDLAIGIVIGAAFGKIVTSFVSDVLMPPIGLLIGNADFSDLYVNLGSTPYESATAAREAGAPIIQYGAFFNTMLDFVIVAFAIFLVVKAMNRMKRKEEAAPPPAPGREEILLTEIRDLLKARQ